VDVFEEPTDEDFDQRVDIARDGIIKAFREKRRYCAENMEEGVR